MSFRTRLALILGALVLVPLVAAALLVAYAVPRASADRAESLVVSARSSVTAALAGLCERTEVAARTVGRDTAVVSPDAAARGAVDDNLADWAAVAVKTGRVVGGAGVLPDGSTPDRSTSCQQGTASGPNLMADVQISVAGQPRLTRAWAANAVDTEFLDELRLSLGFSGDILLLEGSDVVAATSRSSVDPTAAEAIVQATPAEQPAAAEGGVTAAVGVARPGVPFTVVVAVASPDNAFLIQSVFFVVLLAVVLAVFVAIVVARDMTRPLEDVTIAAEFVAAGDLTQHIDIVRDDEVGRLARAFNYMTDELRDYVEALEGSRDALRGNLGRLGDALSATHDLQTLLPVVLETAMSSVGAGAGLVLLGDESGELTVHAEHGMRTRGLTVPGAVTVGEGLLGSVAGSGLTVRGVIGSTDELRPNEAEPQGGEILAVPLKRSPHVFGVIALFSPSAGTAFTEEDESALLALAGQAAIAVENVMLHAEAQRASTIDSLTGLWNFRYLTDSLNREIERALRFDRSLALLMLDLDRFKNVNDTYGHQRGDEVLREFATRVSVEIREVDTLARYGGEEFVLVLPETTIAGASRLADRICEAVRSRPFGGPDDVPLPITVSIGAAVFPEHAQAAAKLLGAADQALYGAKRSGRDRWAVAQATIAKVDR